jgi:hypothetical protein
MVCGLHLHRRQITFDTIEVESGEEWRGRIWQPDRARLQRHDQADRHQDGPQRQLANPTERRVHDIGHRGPSAVRGGGLVVPAMQPVSATGERSEIGDAPDAWWG